MTRARRFMLRAFVTGTTLAVAAGTSLAQADIVRPPKAEDPGEVSYVLVLGIALVCAAITLGINLLPSRRTHQD
ncbi:MAG: hypothetical protein ACKVZJ_05330 [Phycisphaerales bacterium]